GIGPIGALRWPPHGIEFALRAVQSVAGRQLTQHLLGHLACSLSQLLKRARFLLGGAVEVAIAQRTLGALHGVAGAVELTRGLQSELTHPPLQPAKHLVQLPLPIAERARLIAFALAVALLLTLTLLSALPWPALALLALTALAPLTLTALLAKRVVEQLLLPTKQTAEFVHHLAEAVALALVGHGAGLQPIQQIAQLAQHLLGHVAVAGTGHVLEVAQHLLDVLRRHELAVTVHALHGRLVLRIPRQLLQELGQGLAEL